MNLETLITGVGLGTLLSKLLDIVWLQKILERNEKRKWLRKERYKAFQKLSRELLTFGLNSGVLKSAANF